MGATAALRLRHPVYGLPGWEQLINSNPQYGTDSGAFGERLGAAALLQNSRAVLSDGIMAAIFRQDPRYYRQGHRPI